jgi:hypothetical protein
MSKLSFVFIIQIVLLFENMAMKMECLVETFNKKI